MRLTVNKTRIETVFNLFNIQSDSWLYIDEL